MQIKVLTPPAHGEIVIRQGPSRRPHDAPGVDCGGTEPPATMAYYRSTHGFTGCDATELRRFSSDGHVRTMPFDISVQ